MSDHITDASKKVGRPQIREVFLRNGARIEPDRDDLPDYVYESVFELLELAAPAVQDEKPRQYSIGPLTYEKVFKAAGLTNLSDMQAVLDAVESELSASAAPAVQGEPVAYMFADECGRTKIVLGKETAEHWCPSDENITPLYAAPQPAEQQAVLLQAELERERQRRFDGNEQASREHREDVAALAEALERIASLPMNSCSTENDYRLSAAKAIALAAVSDYRKGGEI